MKKRIISFVAFFLISVFAFSALAQENQPIRVEVLRDFKGLDTKSSTQDLTKEFADQADNIRFTNVGELDKRKSRSKYNSTELENSTGFTYLERIYASSTGRLIAEHGAHLLVGHDGTGTFSELKSNLTTGLRWMGATFKNWHYMGNGTDDNLRTDGTKTYTQNMGCAVPASAPTAAIGAGTGLTGAYSYKVTYLYDAYQESNGSSASNSVTVSNQKIDLTNIPTTTHPNVASVKIYRTEASGTTYKLVTTISEGTTTYTDSLADGSLGSDIPTDNGLPQKFKYTIVHKERIFGVKANDSNVYFSDITGVTSYPDIFPATNYLGIAPDDGDIITGLAHDPNGMLVAFKKNSIYHVYTVGRPSQWGHSAKLDFHGCIAPYTIAETPQGIIYMSRSGERGKELRIFDGSNSRIISERIEPTLNAILTSQTESSVGFYYENKYLLSYVGENVTYNNRVLILDLLRDAYTIDKGKNINCFSHWSAGDDRGQLYTASSNEGYAFREDASSFDLVHDLKSELDAGTYSQQESSGTENNPEVYLISAQLTDDFGGTNWESLTTTNWEDYTGDNDTWYPSGSLISEVIEVNAANLTNLYWTESLSSGDIQFWIRTGNSTAETEAASWSGPYTTPAGSDISAVTAKKYIQYKVKLYTHDATIVTTPKLYLANNYVIKISLGLGTLAESSIEFNYRLGELDFGTPYLTKRFRQIRTNHSTGGTSGTFNIYYSLDGGSEQTIAVDLSTDSTNSKKNFPSTAFGERMRLRFNESSINNFKLKGVEIILSDEPLRYQ